MDQLEGNETIYASQIRRKTQFHISTSWFFELSLGNHQVIYDRYHSIEQIEGKIFTIRNQQLMLDRDLAELYQVETRASVQAVKRNLDRFPGDFMFQLTKEELENWKSQIVISNSVKMGLRKLPYAFTELGVAMLSSVLNSKKAIQVNIQIMKAFHYLKKRYLEDEEIRTELQSLDQKIDLLAQKQERDVTFIFSNWIG